MNVLRLSFFVCERAMSFRVCETYTATQLCMPKTHDGDAVWVVGVWCLSCLSHCGLKTVAGHSTSFMSFNSEGQIEVYIFSFRNERRERCGKPAHSFQTTF